MAPQRFSATQEDLERILRLFHKMLTHGLPMAGPDTKGVTGVTLFQQEDYNLKLPRFLKKLWQLGIKGTVSVQNEKRV